MGACKETSIPLDFSECPGASYLHGQSDWLRAHVSDVTLIEVIHIYLLCVSVCPCMSTCRNHRTACWDWFFPSILWILGVELRLLESAPGIYAQEAISLAPTYLLKV